MGAARARLRKLWLYSDFLYRMVAINILSMRGSVIGRLMSSLVPFTIQIFVLLFVLPVMGISKQYTQMVLISRFFISDSVGAVAGVLSGLESRGPITHALIAPVPAWVVLVGTVLGYAARMFVTTVILIPVAILALLRLVNFSATSILVFFAALLTTSVFDSLLGLWGSAWTVSLAEVPRVWVRFINPLSFIAVYSPRWLLLFATSPSVAIFLLANPFLYVHEMGRAAIFGQDWFISPVLCAAALIFASSVFAVLGVRRLKRRFDLI